MSIIERVSKMIREAYISAFYEGAGGDAWNRDHDDEGELVDGALVKKDLEAWMLEVQPELDYLEDPTIENAGLPKEMTPEEAPFDCSDKPWEAYSEGFNECLRRIRSK